MFTDVSVPGIDEALNVALVRIGDVSLGGPELLRLQAMLRRLGVLELARELLKNGMDVIEVQILIGYLGGYDAAT